MSDRPCLLAATAFGALTLLVAQPAWANAYAYAWQHVSGIVFGGATMGSPVFGASDTAAFDGFPPPDKDSAALDPRQVERGRASIPTANDFMQQTRLERARADALITAGGVAGFGGDGVAEAYRESAGTATGSSNGIATFTLTQTTDEAIVISLLAHPVLHDETSATGEIARSAIAFVISFKLRGAAGALFTWKPDGTGADFSKPDDSIVKVLSDPFDLQKELTCTDVCSADYDQSGKFSISFQYRKGQQYDVEVSWNDFAFVKAVPEADTPHLLVAAAIGATVARRRRR